MKQSEVNDWYKQNGGVVDPDDFIVNGKDNEPGLKQILRAMFHAGDLDNAPPGSHLNDRINGQNECASITAREYRNIIRERDWLAAASDNDEPSDDGPDLNGSEPDLPDNVDVNIDKSGMDDLHKGLAKAFEDAITINTSAISTQVKRSVRDIRSEIQEKLKKLENRTPRKLQVQRPDGSTHDVDTRHRKFEDLLQLAQLRHNVMLVGPAGTGKSKACEQVAHALGIDFYFQSISNRSQPHDFFGYTDAEGEAVITDYERAYTEGGLYLLDEVDNANPNALKSINASISNGHASFASGIQSRHEDFILFASANTFGRGADMEYVGSNQLDSATLDRFVMVEFNYDHELEKKIAGDTEWTRHVQNIREAILDHGQIKHVVSMRASILGNQQLEAGMDRETVEKRTIWKGLEETYVEKIKERIQ